jgi:hypothetical protein
MPRALLNSRQGIMSGIIDGMTFGVGSAIAHRAVDAVMGPRTVQVEHVNSSAAPAPAAPAAASSSSSNNACMDQYNNFQECLKNSGGNVGSCQFYFDMLQQCQRGQ